jgi:hypothetical protein
MPRCRFVMEQDLDIVGSGYRHPRVREQEADRTPVRSPCRKQPTACQTRLD